MVSLKLTAGIATNPLSFTVDVNTNSSLIVNGNSVQITIPGIYEVVGAVTAESSASGAYGLSVYANGSAYASPFINLAAAGDEETTIPVYAVVDIVENNVSGYATITFVPTGAPTIVSGTISIKRIQ